jgi:16S rRNA A1518/A1519 N6-dimethyltransferase RsmA/KsgA/DIM1 with predicted DNA glycosylase/AP lyase activity
MKAKKSLGQSFLINRNAAKRIASLIEPTATDTVIEIGGGHGELTTWLVDSGAGIYVVEVDSELASQLQEKFSVRPNFSLIEQDIREVIPAEFESGNNRIKLIGNIPYEACEFISMQNSVVTDSHIVGNRNPVSVKIPAIEKDPVVPVTAEESVHKSRHKSFI